MPECSHHRAGRFRGGRRCPPAEVHDVVAVPGGM